MAESFVVNELLCFVKFHYGKVPKVDILTCINGFYTDEEVSQAKKLIFQLLDGAEPKVSDPPRCVIRKESNNKRRLECEDTLGAFECCDKHKVKLPRICAVDLNRLPKLTPSDVDVVRTAESVGVLKEQMADLSSQVNELKQVIMEVANPAAHAKGSTNITTPLVTLQPKVSVAALDDFNLDDDNSTDILRTSMNKEQWFVQSKKKKKTQPTAVRKLVGKGNNVSTSIKAVAKESPKS